MQIRREKQRPQLRAAGRRAEPVGSRPSHLFSEPFPAPSAHFAAEMLMRPRTAGGIRKCGGPATPRTFGQWAATERVSQIAAGGR